MEYPNIKDTEERRCYNSEGRIERIKFPQPSCQQDQKQKPSNIEKILTSILTMPSKK